MKVKHITPIINVSDVAASFAWFEKWGWKKAWDWGTPPDFGAVQSDDCDIFLSLNCQGGRGRGTNSSTFGPEMDVVSDKGSWICVAVDDVDAVHRQCVAANLDVTFPPTGMPWNFREMHVRHPGGHVFRVGTVIEDDD